MGGRTSLQKQAFEGKPCGTMRLSTRFYVNKNLNLDNIQVYGFDYDYTLAHYSSNLQSLIYDLAKEYMVNEVSLCIHPLHLVAAIIVKCC